MFISEAYAQAAGAQAAAPSLIGSFLPLALIVVLFWLLMIRPQQKKMKEHRAKLDSIRRGDRIVTGGGIYGVVTRVEADNDLQVEIAEGVRVKVARATVTDVLTKGEPAKAAEPAAEAKDSKKEARK